LLKGDKIFILMKDKEKSLSWRTEIEITYTIIPPPPKLIQESNSEIMKKESERERESGLLCFTSDSRLYYGFIIKFKKSIPKMIYSSIYK